MSLTLILGAWTGTAHAGAMLACNEPVAARTIVHVAGDGDEAPADAHKAYPHHHDDCHGQHASMPAIDQVVAERFFGAPAYGIRRVSAMMPCDLDGRLRPPRA